MDASYILIIFVMIAFSTYPAVPVLETIRRVEKADKKKVVAAAFGVSISFAISLWGGIAASMAFIMQNEGAARLLVLFVGATAIAFGMIATLSMAVRIESAFLRKASAREWAEWRAKKYGADPFQS